jgi:hypothetical protein
MEDVNRHFVIPWTRGTGCSVALLMNPSSQQKAELMISHTWGEDVDELVEALEFFQKRYRVPFGTPVFFCPLSVYQPGDGARGALTIPEQIALAPFKRVINALPRYGMVVVHTTAEEVYSRMWCAHEVAEALEAGVKMRGAMSQRFQTKFEGTASQVWLDVRTERATCRFQDDERMLREAIQRKPGSFGRLDEVILQFRREMFAMEELLHETQTQLVRSAERSVRVVRRSRLLRQGQSILRWPASSGTYGAVAAAGLRGRRFHLPLSADTSWAMLPSKRRRHPSGRCCNPERCCRPRRLADQKLQGGVPHVRAIVSPGRTLQSPCVCFTTHMPGLLSRASLFIDKSCVAEDANSIDHSSPSAESLIFRTRFSSSILLLPPVQPRLHGRWIF